MVAVPQSTAGEQAYQTPPEFFRALDQRVHEKYGSRFGLDAAASVYNAHCNIFIDERRNALDGSVCWSSYAPGLGIFCNPPYKRRTKNYPGVGGWIERGARAALKGAPVVAFLLRVPSMGASWYVASAPYCETEIATPRLDFIDPATGEKARGVPHSSMVMYFTKETIENPQHDPLRIRFWNWRK